MTQRVLELEQVSAGYGAATVLRSIDLKVEQGTLVAVIGPNGAGKSTLLRTISGLIRAREGDIRLMGERITRDSPEAIARRRLAHVPEGRRVFADQSVVDNLLLGGYIRAGREGHARLRAEAMSYLDRFPQLGRRAQSPAGLLSGGEQQILAVARALISKPKLIMLDEPSMGLAPRVVDDLLELLVEERRAGMTILLVEQMAFAALSIADVGYVLSNGAIQAHGPAQGLLANSNIREAYFGTGVGDVVH